MTFFQISRCRNMNTLCRITAALFVTLSVTRGSVLADLKDSGTTVDRLVDEAGQAKIVGNLAYSLSLLHDAVRIDPHNRQARWQLGQVKVDGEWLSVEEAQRRAAADPRQTEFRQRKEVVSENPQDQLELARWCRKNDLKDEARFYWSNVLTADPTNKEALRAVGMRWHDGQLVSFGQVKESKKDASAVQLALRQWTPSVATWMRALAKKNESPPTEVVDQIRAIRDVAAIPAFEKITLNNNWPSFEKNPAPRRLSLAFLGALMKMPDDAATKSLVRHAVQSPFEDVRAGAIAQLRYRPLNDFVPMLLDGLAAPVQSTYNVVTDPNGSVRYSHAIYREGPFADWSYRSSRSIYQPGAPIEAAANLIATESRPTIVNTVANTSPRPVSSAGAKRSAQRYEEEIVSAERQVAETNESTAALNERIVAALTGVSDQSLGNEPRPWWNWWQDYTDYYRTGDRPIYLTQDNSSDYVVPPVESYAVECFVRGTPVWTRTGLRPIESLDPGDLVLAQNVNTGELTYKPVLRSTVRPAGPILKLSIGDERLFSTRGHPFWVAGVGWRMAKELEDGAILHGATDAVRIGAIDPASDAETFNLVVADFNTYFVGESGILVHDNTPRQPTRAGLPGLKAN